MIDIYSEWNTDYSHNGDVTLDPMRCDFTPILNGSWEMELEAPLDSQNKFLELQAGAVIRTDTPIGKNQLFRIYDTQRTSESVVAYARPVFLDSAHDVFLVDCRPTNMTGQECLDYLMDGTPYTGKTDISISKTAYYVRKNLIEALAGNEDNSFLSRWGGEISYDNYTINIMSRLGSDNGLRAEFGRNISQITETIDTDSMATRVVPVAFNGYTLDGDEPWVDSLRINDYPIVHTKVVDFENLRMAEDVEEGSDAQGFDTLEELQAAMIDAVWDLYNEGLDTPQVTYQINLVDLRRMDAYKGYEGLEDINLGDTVHCYHRKLGIETEARVVQYTFDCIRQCITSITIGDYKEDYFDAINAAITSSGTIVDFDSIATEIAFIKSNYIQTNGLEAALAYIGYLSADQIMADHATIIDLEASYAQIGELEADVAYILDLTSQFITTDYLEANYARIAQLEALSIYTVDLAAQAANIESVLAGNVGTGTLQTIYLTSDNVVIQDALITNAMIANVSADKLTAGTIYTDFVKIANNEGQNLWIDGATIQITDENDIVRVQIGMDASGDYNLYLWDSVGILIWNAYGLTEEGLTGNGAIIRDAAVADDANIQEHKIDMQSVANRLNSDGMIVVDGTNVIIDGEQLNYALNEIQMDLSAVADLASYGIDHFDIYYALGTSDTEPPDGAVNESTVLGEWILGVGKLGESYSTDWTLEQPQAGDGQYVWMRYLVFYIDPDKEPTWTDPTCLTDGYLVSTTRYLQTQFKVVQGEISSYIAATEILEGEVTTLHDQYSSVVQTVDSITSTVADISTTVGEGFEYMETRMSVIEQTADEINMSVEHVEQSMYDLEEIVDESVIEVVNYYALGTSPDEPPDGATNTGTVLGEWILGEGLLGTANSTDWSTERQTAGDGQYLWMVQELHHVDGSVTYTEPTCLTDAWIISYTHALKADIDIREDSILSYVYDVEQIVHEDYTELYAKYSEVEQTAEGITSTVVSVQNDLDGLEYRTSQVEQTAEGLSVELVALSSNVDETITKVSNLEYTVEGLSLSFETIEGEIGEGVASVTNYYALGTSDTDPPDGATDTGTVLGEWILGTGLLGMANATDWTTERQIAGDGQFLWMKQYITYIDEDKEPTWTEPTCLTDGWERTKLVSYGSSLDVLEQSIEAKVWMNDITEATNELGEKITVVDEKYADVYIDIDRITAEVDEYMTVTTDNINGVIERVGIIEVRVDEIDLTVSDVQTWQANFKVGGTQILRGTNSGYDIQTSSSDGQWADSRWGQASNYGTTYGTRTVVDVTDSPNANIVTGWEYNVTASQQLDLAQRGVPVAVGETYTLSCYIYAKKSGGYFDFGYGASPYQWQYFYLDSGYVGHWMKISFTFELDDSYVSDGKTNIYVGCYQASNVIVAGLKLEYGSTATDWSDAPEDINVFITEAKEAAIQITEDSITSYVNDTFTYQSDFLTYTQENDARIEILDNSITSTVSSVTLIESKYTKYGTCDTDGDTAAKVATVDDFDSDCLIEGSVVVIYFTYANTRGNPSLNVNGTGAKTIMGGGSSLATSRSRYWWSDKATVTFVYYGGYWNIVDSDATSKIQQLADSITLEVTSSSNGTATIVLSADGSEAGSLTAVTGARKAFENENNTTCTVTSGTITFSSNTIVIDSDYFTVSETGVITATSGRIGGWSISANQLAAGMTVGSASYYVYIASPSSTMTAESMAFSVYTSSGGFEWYVQYDGYMYAKNAYVEGTLVTVSGTRTTTMTSGRLEYGYNGTAIGSFYASYWETGDGEQYPNLQGITLDGEYGGMTFIGFGRKSSTTASVYSLAYYISYNGIISSYRHNFSGTVYMDSTLTMNAQIYLTNNYGIRMYKADGENYEAVFYMDSNDRLHIGYTKAVAYLHGEFCLDNGYALEGLDPTGGTRRYLLCITDQDNVVVGSANSPLYLRGEGVYLYGTTTAVTSDRRLKCDIADLDESYDTVFDALAPIEYRYRMGGGLHLGFTTQDMQAALTEGGKDYTDYAMLSTCLNEEDSTWYGALAYDEIIALLVYELQKTKKEVAELKAAAGMEDRV